MREFMAVDIKLLSEAAMEQMSLGPTMTREINEAPLAPMFRPAESSSILICAEDQIMKHGGDSKWTIC